MGSGDTQAIAKTHVFIVLCRGFILFSLCLYMNKSSIVTTDCISHAYEFCINPIVVIIVRCTAFLVLVSWIKRSRLFWRLLSMPLVIWNSAFEYFISHKLMTASLLSISNSIWAPCLSLVPMMLHEYTVEMMPWIPNFALICSICWRHTRSKASPHQVLYSGLPAILLQYCSSLMCCFVLAQR